MAINQLFKTKPLFEDINNIFLLISIDLNGLNKKNSFILKDLKDHEIEKNYVLINEILDKYYLPCKKRIYLDNLNYKKIITILRQLVKLYNLKIQSINKYNNGNKHILYIIKPIINNNNKKKINCIISFD